MMTSLQFRQKRRAQGLTLTELAIVMGAMGLVMAAVWAVVGVVWNNYQSQRMTQQTVTVVQNVRDYYMNASRISCTTGNSITAMLDDDTRRLIPTEMRSDPDVSGTGINHAMATTGSSVNDGSFRVFCLDSGVGFRISLGGLKREDCVRLLMQFPVLTPEMGLKNVVRPGGTIISINLLNMETPGTGFPMTITTANSWCESPTNEVSFDFKLRN